MNVKDFTKHYGTGFILKTHETYVYTGLEVKHKVGKYEKNYSMFLLHLPKKGHLYITVH